MSRLSEFKAETIEAALNYWRSTLNGENPFPDASNILAATSSLPNPRVGVSILTRAREANRPSPSQLEEFIGTLRKYLTGEVKVPCEFGYGIPVGPLSPPCIYLEVDYHPRGVLDAAAKAARLQQFCFPSKQYMRVYPEHIELNGEHLWPPFDGNRDNKVPPHILERLRSLPDVVWGAYVHKDVVGFQYTVRRDDGSFPEDLFVGSHVYKYFGRVDTESGEVIEDTQPPGKKVR